MATYVLSDIHGCYQLFQDMLKKIEFSKQDTLYIIGDVFDRGPEPIRTLLYIMEQKNMIMLRGNHESFFLDYLRTKDYSLWFQNGGYITLSQYFNLPKEKQEDIIKYITHLPLYAEVGDYILIHAGIVKGDYPLSKAVKWEQVKKYQNDDSLWIREDFYNYPALQDKIVIFGHTPTCYLNNYPKNSLMSVYLKEDKIGIDCGAVFPTYGGRLACMNLDTKAIFYVD